MKYGSLIGLPFLFLALLAFIVIESAWVIKSVPAKALVESVEKQERVVKSGGNDVRTIDYKYNLSVVFTPGQSENTTAILTEQTDYYKVGEIIAVRYASGEAKGNSWGQLWGTSLGIFLALVVVSAIIWAIFWLDKKVSGPSGSNLSP